MHRFCFAVALRFSPFFGYQFLISIQMHTKLLSLTKSRGNNFLQVAFSWESFLPHWISCFFHCNLQTILYQWFSERSHILRKQRQRTFWNKRQLYVLWQKWSLRGRVIGKNFQRLRYMTRIEHKHHISVKIRGLKNKRFLSNNDNFGTYLGKKLHA